MLDRFGEALRFAGAPLGEDFLPGLTDAAIDGLGESLGVAIPPELRTLWRWRMPPKNSKRPGAWDLNPAYALRPPKKVVELTLAVREELERPFEQIAFAGKGLTVLMVATDSGSPPSPVIESPFDDPDQYDGEPNWKPHNFSSDAILKRK